MLTKQDLDQIRNVIREEVENEVAAARDEIKGDVITSRMYIQENISQLKDRVKNIEIKTTRMHKDLKNEIKLVVNFLDKENVKIARRVKKIEDGLGLTS